MIRLTRRQRHFLTLLNAPGATVAMGLEVGDDLHHMGLVMEAKWGRYGITPKGREAIAQEELSI
jgi:hypothetical protein